jgi:electron transfer flavoprotein alpha subunit
LVAGVLVYIEREGDRSARASLEALGEGRRIATSLGAPLCAFAPLSPSDDADAAVSYLGSHGADQVLLMQSPELTGPAAWVPHGAALYAAAERIRPLLVLLSATAGGRDIGPRLAARLGAAFAPEASIECGPRGEIVLTRTLYRAEYMRRLAAEDIGRVVVATLTPASYALAKGSADDAEVLALEPPTFGVAPYELSDEPDPDAVLERAEVVVTAGAAVQTPEQYELIARLARALGGEIAATKTLCERGLAPASREIGVGARHVAPRLYIACGASGSPEHLGAVSADAEIVAINSDPDAPIFRVARYGVVGTLDDVVPAMIEALS